MSEIISVKSLQVLDSRGNPTVEAEVLLKNGAIGRASVPSGASTGSREAVELRDGIKEIYLGKGVSNAVENINSEIQSALMGLDIYDQKSIDQTMITLDGTENKSRLGANAILAVSLACIKAAAASKQTHLFEYLSDGPYSFPVPMMNIINGGEHANNNIDIQEFMILPVNFDRFSDALRAGVEIFHSLKGVLDKNGMSTAVGDEGGFAPNLENNVAAIDTIIEAIESRGYEAGNDVLIGLDVASTEFYRDGKYHLSSEGKSFDSSEFVDYLSQMVKAYPIITVEDGMAEDDWEGWKLLTDAIGEEVQLVGDDLFVTNPSILKQGIEREVANSILIKPNQIGTLTETLESVSLANKHGYTSVISHRSGETSDSTIADISMSPEISQIKTGSLCRSDRIEKYNQLLRIESVVGDQAEYPGKKAFNQFK
ncbi:MAG: phosphopyruvate hydratase [Gammaproteobacteria bacterium]|jgi:enolase|nr:phosphopyruvate hydratase [Gammaproteobacteria bacterium]MDP6146799.1 phosphopyruvate hydratase [Gammaproteobacteria bacterium]HJL80024.1 phosphopyruvate hydratase [Gammaproteobacteria bacterium]|tara:strand:- start:24635 stop:25915 length:1281 start_codon:yes stop_codon:yes gene_type:complete